MDLRTTETIEATIDGAAALLFAAATAFAIIRAGGSPSPALAGAAVAFLGAYTTLRAIRPREPVFAIAGFSAEPVPVRDLEELLLELSDRFQKPASADELVLDDVLANPQPDSRVVRLFDPAAMPADSPAFDRQFGCAIAVPAPPDASQALHEALSKLRHSLR
jgi:hypothetical protein